MKKILLLIPILFAFSCAEKENKEITETIIQEMPIPNQPDSVLRHVVYFSFKESSSEAEIQSVVDAFRNLQNEIDGIESFEWGVNSSPEGINQGLTHAFTLTFYSDAARDAYLPHPSHKAFGEILGPHLDKVMVLDYWTRK
ncbi:MAG: Dabb family protein [Algoriphagus sp.]|uniref:Dabb family protein n=1 Tax=Algoriphagus sp. TaxID=1872435 RepID=UPI00260BECDB|nr:Dabb family protein [Algoriphagus sp.]MDG1278004.1 Dabb family protein [Algoriphagus sp.]